MLPAGNNPFARIHRLSFWYRSERIVTMKSEPVGHADICEHERACRPTNIFALEGTSYDEDRDFFLRGRRARAQLYAAAAACFYFWIADRKVESALGAPRTVGMRRETASTKLQCFPKVGRFHSRLSITLLEERCQNHQNTLIILSLPNVRCCANLLCRHCSLVILVF